VLQKLTYYLPTYTQQRTNKPTDLVQEAVEQRHTEQAVQYA